MEEGGKINKQKILKVFIKHNTVPQLQSGSTLALPNDKGDAYHEKKDVKKIKVKCLKSRKERSQRSRKQEAHFCRKQSKRCCSKSTQSFSRNIELYQPSTASEACIITSHRLTGHSGLFNHKVTSIDIERLLSDQHKSRPCADKGTGLYRKSPHSRQSSTVLQSEAHCSHSFTSTPAVEEDHQSKAVNSSCCDAPHDSNHQEVPETTHYEVINLNKPPSLLSHSILFSPETNKLASQALHQDINPQQTPNLPSNCRRSDKFTSMILTPQQVLSHCDTRELTSFSSQLATVASDVCRALQLPDLHKGTLLTETREALLEILQDTHGHLLENNLLSLHQSTKGQALNKEEDSSFIHNGCLTGELDQPWASSVEKRVKRQVLKNRKLRAEIEEVQLDSSTADKHPADFTRDFLKMRSPEFLRFSQPSSVFSPSASGRETAQPWNQMYKKAAIEREGWRYNESSGHTKPNFFKFSSEGSKLVPDPDWAQTSFDSVKSGADEAFSSSVAPPLSDYYLKPFHRSRSIATSRFHKSGNDYYPPSQLLEKELSPLSPIFPLIPSPNCWSFPRMKLY